MPGNNRYKILVLTGPTAVGKTRIALSLSEKHGWEIISADSRQIYRDMDIGTAKPTQAERDRVPHHLIDIRNPDEYYSAGNFLEDAVRVKNQLEAENRKYCLVGGSGFYINAFLCGGVSGRPSDPQIKEQLRKRLGEEGGEELYRQLEKADPKSAQRIHPHDHYRILRALEIVRITGQPVASPQGDGIAGEYHLIGLDLKREQLYRRIEERVDQMLKAGLVDEVKRLRELGYTKDMQALKTFGYQEVYDYLEGLISREAMREQIQQHTRQYAKRQLTWFRKQPLRWIPVTGRKEAAIIGELESILEREEG